MAKHKELLSRMRARLADADAGAPAASPEASSSSSARVSAGAACVLSRDVSDDRELLVSYLLHAADLHNALLPPPLSQRIAASLSEEFAAQAALERAAGLPVTVMVPPTPEARAQMEVGFVDYVVTPVYSTLVAIAPPLRASLRRVEENRRCWLALAGTAAQAADAAAGASRRASMEAAPVRLSGRSGSPRKGALL